MEEAFKDVTNQIADYARNVSSIEKVMLYGYRAREDNRQNSDINLCIFCDKSQADVLVNFRMFLDELDPYFTFDVCHYEVISNDKLKENILSEGKVIYDKYKIKT